MSKEKLDNKKLDETNEKKVSGGWIITKDGVYLTDTEYETLVDKGFIINLASQPAYNLNPVKTISFYNVTTPRGTQADHYDLENALGYRPQYPNYK